MIYMDNASTTLPDKEALDKAMKYLTSNFANPSSSYTLANNAKAAIEIAREDIANIIGANYKEIYFTSGGSESNNWALIKAAELQKDKGRHIISSKIEHHSVLNTLHFLEKQGFEVTYLDVYFNGKISLEQLENSIRSDTILISLMFANNEVGTLEPIYEIGQIAKEHNILFHTDAVQAVGHIDIDVKKLNIDLLSASAHKFYGVKGTGFLYIKQNIKLQPLLHGGNQERNKRAGTENVFGIVAMAEALKICHKNLNEEYLRQISLRDNFISRILDNIKGSHLNGDTNDRLPGNINIYFEGIDGELLLILLNQEGICASLGSACTTGSIEPSHVIMAMYGSPKRASSSLRLTLGKDSTVAHTMAVLGALVKYVNKLRGLS